MTFFRKNGGLLLSALLVLGLMVMIFCFSAQDGEESGRTSGVLTNLVLHLMRPDYDSLSPGEQQEVFERFSFAVRKLGHFTEYALLGCALGWHLTEIHKRRPFRRPRLWAWAVAALYAMSDEFHHSFVGGRGPSFRDVGIDSLGAAAGVLCFLLLMWIILKVRNRKNN